MVAVEEAGEVVAEVVGGRTTEPKRRTRREGGPRGGLAGGVGAAVRWRDGGPCEAKLGLGRAQRVTRGEGGW